MSQRNQSRARLAALSRYRDPADPDLTAARVDLRAESLLASAERLAADAPPLTAAQRARLGIILGPLIDDAARGGVA